MQYINFYKIVFSRSFSSNNSFNFKPVVIYDNADKDKIKIFNDNRGKVAIYRWVNQDNGNYYIGSSTNLSVRMYTYYSLVALAKSNRTIDRAILKYGFSNFRLEILEYCTLKNVLEREQYYIDNSNPVYNIAKVAGSTLGYKHTTESIEKMRNFVMSEEVKIKKALSTINATNARKISIKVTNIKSNDITVYDSITDASKALKVSKAAVSQALLGNKLLKKLYIINRN